MRIFDWIRGGDPGSAPPSRMSRREFFTRVAGEAAAPPFPASSDPDTDPASPERTDGGPGVLCRFHVARFPFHDGPVLVPVLRAGLEFRLAPDDEHPSDPAAVRIDWGKDVLGYVPPEHGANLRARLEAGEALRCRSVRVDTTAELARVLEVEVTGAEAER